MLGRGDISTIKGVRELRDMIVDVAGRASELIDREMTYEQVLAARPTADYDERWGSLDRFLGGLYESLARDGL